MITNEGTHKHTSGRTKEPTNTTDRNTSWRR